MRLWYIPEICFVASPGFSTSHFSSSNSIDSGYGTPSTILDRFCLRLCRCFGHGVNICMCFSYIPEITFCHFFCVLNLAICRAQIVYVTPLTVVSG